MFFESLNIIDCRCFLQQVLNHFNESNYLVRYIKDFSYNYLEFVEYVEDFIDVIVIM